MWTTYQEHEKNVCAKGCAWTVGNEHNAEELAMADMASAKELAAQNGSALHRSLEHFLKRYKCFVSLNTRATNDYSDRTKLVYLCNIHPNPEIQKFFGARDARINDDLFAINMMIQWIWRSAIRDHQDIWLWVPAWRMRNLLQDWLSPAEDIISSTGVVDLAC